MILMRCIDRSDLALGRMIAQLRGFQEAGFALLSIEEEAEVIIARGGAALSCRGTPVNRRLMESIVSVHIAVKAELAEHRLRMEMSLLSCHGGPSDGFICVIVVFRGNSGHGILGIDVAAAGERTRLLFLINEFQIEVEGLFELLLGDIGCRRSLAGEFIQLLLGVNEFILQGFAVQADGGLRILRAAPAIGIAFRKMKERAGNDAVIHVMQLGCMGFVITI